MSDEFVWTFTPATASAQPMGSASSRFDVLLKVQKDFLDIVRRSRDLALYCEKQGAEVPDGLRGILAALGDVSAGKATQALPLVPPTPAAAVPYKRPPDVPADWISIPTPEALVYTLVQVVLYAALTPVKIRQIADGVARFGQSVTDEQINSIGTRLRKKEIIEFTPNGWMFRDRANTLRAVNDRVWGPVSAFNPWEIAAHRREAIVWFLRVRGSITRMELAHLLESADWVEPQAKHLIYSDIKALVRHGIMRKPATGEPSARLELVEQKGSAQLRLASQM